jgi:endo-alpha-1,4-polygalactosaminidase (GH114 family)
VKIAAVVLLVLAGLTGSAQARAPRVALPAPAAVFDYQIGGAYRPEQGVRIVDRDRTDSPAPGYYNICYVNAFQTQPGARHWWTHRHPNLLLRNGHGGFLTDPDWPGEYVLNTSTAARRAAIARIVGRWVDGCARKGFDAIEPDNLDSWTRKGVGHRLTRADNLDLATRLARRAHGDGLAIAQKNTVEVSRAGRNRVHFDFAIAEECQVYGGCGGYRAYYGRRVYEIEYSRSAYRAACARRGRAMSIILRDLDVTPRGDPHYLYKHC